jgi:hypothetical protein
MELHEVKIGDMVSFMHKGKKKLGKVVHRHDGTKNAALAGHVNVAPTEANSTPKTLHVSKLTPANKIKEDIHMANITEAIHELIDNIENGNHVEANNIFNDLLQTKIDALIDAKKVEVSSAMFNTENCADCFEEEFDIISEKDFLALSEKEQAEYTLMDEEILSELDKSTSKSYISKARKWVRDKYIPQHPYAKSDPKNNKSNYAKASRRVRGIHRAQDKLGVKRVEYKEVGPANEDVEKTNEALKGAQHKIDMNKNGKLDAMDFKMLRKKK